MSKESTYDCAKLLTCINNAIQYAEAVHRVSRADGKQFFTDILNRLHYARNKFHIRFSPAALEVIKQEAQEAPLFDSVQDILLQLPQKQREQVENYAEALLRANNRKAAKAQP